MECCIGVRMEKLKQPFYFSKYQLVHSVFSCHKWVGSNGAWSAGVSRVEDVGVCQGPWGHNQAWTY
eukprot:2045012-Ditylum_brightwellii.AAC.1